MSKKAKARIGAPLSQKEFEVAYFASQGLGEKQIARRLDLSYMSVRAYMKRVKRKLNVATKLELISWAIAEGV